MSNLFQKLELEAFRKGINPRTQESREWFRRRVQRLTRVNRDQLMREPEVTRRATHSYGGMFMYFYDPKHKKKLPYYDRFPMGFVVDVQKDNFLMMNFHYLPPILRAELMDAIYPFVIFPNVETQDIGSSMRARVNTDRVDFEFMKKRINMRGVIPAWKRYDYKQVVGNYLYVPPVGWDTIVMLPLAMPRKSGINRIWMDSQMERRMRKKSDRTKAKYKKRVKKR